MPAIITNPNKKYKGYSRYKNRQCIIYGNILIVVNMVINMKNNEPSDLVKYSNPVKIPLIKNSRLDLYSILKKVVVIEKQIRLKAKASERGSNDILDIWYVNGISIIKKYAIFELDINLIK